MGLKISFSFIFLLFFSIQSHGQSNRDSLQLNYDSLLQKVSSNHIEYKTFSSRTKMIWDDGETVQEFTGNIRVKKDSLIWLSFGVIGIEGMRVLINPDTFYLINKLTGEHEVRDFNFIQSWILFPVNFKMLQQIITGEKIDIDEKASLAIKEDSSFVLYLETDKLQEKIEVDTTNYTIKKILLKDKLLKQDMTITFGTYNYPEVKPFSYKRSITLNRDAGTIKLGMEFIRINFNEELSFPFEINEKHSR